MTKIPNKIEPAVSTFQILLKLVGERSAHQLVLRAEPDPTAWNRLPIFRGEAFFLNPNPGKIIDASKDIEDKRLDVDRCVGNLFDGRNIIAIRRQNREHVVDAADQNLETSRKSLTRILSRPRVREREHDITHQELVVFTPYRCISFPKLS